MGSDRHMTEQQFQSIAASALLSERRSLLQTINDRADEIERLTTENETLRAGIARCCVGWDDLPYQDQRGAIVTRLEELLGDTDGE